MTISEDLQTQLQKALEECASLRKENERLRNLLSLSSEEIAPPSKLIISEPTSSYLSAIPPVSNSSSIETQISLFRSLFRGREDVYPVRWEGKKGNSGYSPACANEWDFTFCGKPRMKCFVENIIVLRGGMGMKQSDI